MCVCGRLVGSLTYPADPGVGSAGLPRHCARRCGFPDAFILVHGQTLLPHGCVHTCVVWRVHAHMHVMWCIHVFMCVMGCVRACGGTCMGVHCGAGCACVCTCGVCGHMHVMWCVHVCDVCACGGTCMGVHV